MRYLPPSTVPGESRRGRAELARAARGRARARRCGCARTTARRCVLARPVPHEARAAAERRARARPRARPRAIRPRPPTDAAARDAAPPSAPTDRAPRASGASSSARRRRTLGALGDARACGHHRASARPQMRGMLASSPGARGAEELLALARRCARGVVRRRPARPVRHPHGSTSPASLPCAAAALVDLPGPDARRLARVLRRGSGRRRRVLRRRAASGRATPSASGCVTHSPRRRSASRPSSSAMARSARLAASWLTQPVSLSTADGRCRPRRGAAATARSPFSVRTAGDTS